MRRARVAEGATVRLRVEGDVHLVGEFVPLRATCDGLVCGAHGACQDDTGTAVCVCDAGYETPSDCEAGDCVCSRQSCAAPCATCSAATPALCTSCAEPLPLLHDGDCLDACPSGMFEDKLGACQPCHGTCTSCIALSVVIALWCAVQHDSRARCRGCRLNTDRGDIRCNYACVGRPTARDRPVRS